MLVKSKLDSKEVIISQALTDSNISHNEFVLINNLIIECDHIKRLKRL